jgi:ATP-binding cassette subfamily F protein 3
MLVQLQNVSFGHAGHEILKDVSWQVNPGEKIGLVGPNGCGKSTLLKLMCLKLKPDEGEVTRIRSCRTGYLSQTEPVGSGETLLDSLLAPFERVVELRGQLAEMEKALADRPNGGDLLSRYGERQEEYERLGGYTLESRIQELTNDLGFSATDLQRPMASFSGGEVGRVGLLKVLLQEPDLLLLDEPTNHLDIEATERLEERLRQWHGAVVVVSHDRMFLNNVCSKMVEMVGRGLEVFRGSFDDYVEQRRERLRLLETAIEKQKAKIDKLEDYVARNMAGQKARQARSKKKALDKIERIEVPEDPWVRAEQLHLDFSVGERPGGKKVVTAKGLRMGYPPAPPLVEELDLTVFRGERIGIVGPNGSGKSTLLRALLGREAPWKGTVELGADIRVGFFDQNRTDLDEDASLVEEIRKVRSELSDGAARNVLGSLRFSGDDAFRPVRSLSGGEKNRLALGKLSMRSMNLLALDEPTNHLDIPARQALERSLRAFPGTLLVVSHDRYFLNQLVDKVVFVRGGGKVEVVLGNYAEAKKRLGARSGDEPGAGDEPEAKQAGSDRAKEARIAERKARKRLNRELEREKRRVARLEEEIEGLESRIASLDEQLAAHSRDWDELQKLTALKEAASRDLNDKVEEWERLAQRSEGLEKELELLG